MKPQSTNQGCLATVLIELLEQKGVNVNHSELDILTSGLTFTKEDFTIGHLVELCKKYDIEIEQFTDSKWFCEQLTKLNLPENLKIIHQKINKQFIEKIYKPNIVFLDAYYLYDFFGVCHLPHFIILKSFNNIVTIDDPWDGKTKTLSAGKFMKAISSLKNRLYLSPKLIRVYF
jgi:hypothetical protein